MTDNMNIIGSGYAKQPKFNLGAYWELTKPRLVFLNLFASGVGFYLATTNHFNVVLFLFTLLGTGLVAAGSMALNEWMERDVDAKMKRTAHRPVPTGKIPALYAVLFGSIFSIVGLLILELFVNSKTCFLAALTLATYLFVYTPLKKKTSLCTIFGAIPGALPPMIGWAAIDPSLPFESWVLFSILFLWQLPHFLAIAWIHRRDYQNAGLAMLSTDQDGEQSVKRQTLLYTCALLPVSLLPTIVQMTGMIYFSGALLFSSGIIVASIKSLKDFDKNARFLFRASIAYLTVLFILMVIDKV